jgi:fatty acid-binding protein DegV
VSFSQKTAFSPLYYTKYGLKRTGCTGCPFANEWKKEVEEAFPGHEMHMDPLSLSVGCHIGPGALAVTVTRKLHF